jgi:hypothetical protein
MIKDIIMREREKSTPAKWRFSRHVHPILIGQQQTIRDNF